MSREDGWTAEWVKEKYKDTENAAFEVEGTNVVIVRYRGGPEKRFATTSLSSLDVGEVEELLAETGDVHAIINIKNKPNLSKELIDYLETGGIPFGGMADFTELISIDLADFSSYVNKEIRFIFTGLEQHDKVVHVERLDHNRLLLKRVGMLKDCIVYNCNEYDITADVIRQIISKRVELDAILFSNPNHKVSSQALTVIGSKALKTFSWADLLGALNRNNL